MGSGKVEGELWGGRARDWAELGEPTCSALLDAMIEAAEVGPGTVFLDLGCGAGGGAVRAKERHANVSGFDASANLLKIARERVPQGDFRQGDLEELPYDDSTFDVVYAANSVQYAEDQGKAVREALRVKKPDGKFVIGMWCEPDRCEMSGLFKALAPDGPPPGAPPSLAIHQNLLDLLTGNGADVVREGEVMCAFRFANFDEAIRGMLSAGIMQMFEQRLGREFIVNAARDSLAPFRQPEGSYTLNNWFRWADCR